MTTPHFKAYKVLKSLLPLLLLIITACTPERKGYEGDALTLKYASLLTMQQTDSFTLAVVTDAWHPSRKLATYVLVPANRPLPHALPAGTLIRTPLKRAVITSSVHAALITELGAGQNVAGLTDTAYIVSPEVKALLSHGARSMGSAMQPDVELLRAANTDAVFVSPFENAGHGVLDRLGVPLIECADYMETSPLARAEWVKLYGRLFGMAERADSLFASVEESYLHLKEKAATSAETAPTVMCDLLTGGTWYQPGGQSTMGQLITDAGGKYLWADRKEAGSIALNMESVYAKARNADVWLVKYGQKALLSYSQMATDCPQYRNFAPWRARRIYACNTLLTPFYEEVPFHPDLLLRDLISIFHPSIVSPRTATYYAPLANQ